MTRLMYDTDGPASDIPASAKIVAGYVDGASNYLQIVAGHPDALHLPISIHGTKAKCYDLENGALTIVSGVACAKRDIDAGDEWPWLYYSVTNRGAVVAECKRQGVWNKCHHWGAHYLEPDVVPPGYIGLQNMAPNYGSTGHWDRSVMVDHIAGFDPPLPHPPITAEHLKALHEMAEWKRRHPIPTEHAPLLLKATANLQRIEKL